MPNVFYCSKAISLNFDVIYSLAELPPEIIPSRMKSLETRSIARYYKTRGISPFGIVLLHFIDVLALEFS